jgi:hypothetical protein
MLAINETAVVDVGHDTKVGSFYTLQSHQIHLINV